MLSVIMFQLRIGGCLVDGFGRYSQHFDEDAEAKFMMFCQLFFSSRGASVDAFMY